MCVTTRFRLGDRGRYAADAKMKTTNLLLAFLAFVCFAALAWYEVHDVWFAGDRMVGFIFVVTLPAAFIAGLIWLGVAAYRNSWAIAASTAIGGLLAIAPLFFGPTLIYRSWNHSIAQFEKVNANAVTQADFTGFDYTPNHGFYRMDLMPLPQFKWYCDQHIAAPHGVFSGFTINMVPHVYVNKIRHGAKGVAYAPDKSMLPTGGEFNYQYSGVDSWYIWSF